MTLARAVETRRPLVRSTNTGISTAILADGQILQFFAARTGVDARVRNSLPRKSPGTAIFDLGILVFFR